jgi:multidrug resistance efflux pump
MINRILAAIALAGILGWAVYYNLRERNASADNTRHPVTKENHATVNPADSPETVPGGQFEQNLSVSGTVKSDQLAAVSARMPARVVNVLVKNGDVVRSGQSLVQLDLSDTRYQVAGAQAGIDAAKAQLGKAIDGKRAHTVEMDSQISQAEGGLKTALAKQRQAELGNQLTESSTKSDTERANAAVRQAEAGVRQAETGNNQAADTLKRMQFLFSKGGIARVDLEGAQAQAEIARAQRDSAIAALDQAKAAAKPASDSAPLRRQVGEADLEAARAGVRQAQDGVKNAYRAKAETLRIADRDIEAANAQVEQARAGKGQASSQTGSSVLTAPLSGIVTDVAIRAGEMAQPGQPLLTVVSRDKIYFEAAAPARVSSRLRVGAGVRIWLDDRPERVLRGVVSEILPVSPDGRSVPLKIEFTDKLNPIIHPNIGGKADVALTPQK